MISADIKTDVKQEINLSYNLTEVPSQNLKYNVKQVCIFNLILVDIPSSLLLSVKIRGRQGFLLNSQNLLFMTNVIC